MGDATLPIKELLPIESDLNVWGEEFCLVKAT